MAIILDISYNSRENNIIAFSTRPTIKKTVSHDAKHKTAGSYDNNSYNFSWSIISIRLEQACLSRPQTAICNALE